MPAKVKVEPTPALPTTRTSDLIPLLGYRNALLSCNDCRLRASCHSPVPWSGPDQAYILAFGEAPGEREDYTLTPFTGAAGQEFDGYLWNDAFLNRWDLHVSNVVRCRPPQNDTPKEADVYTCSQWTMHEIVNTRPGLILAMGGTPIRAFFGKDARVDDYHGHAYFWTHPWTGVEYPVFCTVHPAAGLHNSKEMSRIKGDFRRLRQYLGGELSTKGDPYEGQEQYIECKTVQDFADLNQIAFSFPKDDGKLHVAVDTEWTPDNKLWCVTVSPAPALSFFVWAEDAHRLAGLLNHPNIYVDLHSAQADLRPLASAGIKPHRENMGDTMIEAYILELPQGLKELAKTRCGMEMTSYHDTVQPYQVGMSRAFLEKIIALNENGTLPTPVKEKGDRRHNVFQKVRRALLDLNKDESNESDIRGRWEDWGADQTGPVAEVVGEWPEASLTDVPFKDAKFYACRDADATGRIEQDMRAELLQWNSFSGRVI